jgi:hypothetical protein
VRGDSVLGCNIWLLVGYSYEYVRGSTDDLNTWWNGVPWAEGGNGEPTFSDEAQVEPEQDEEDTEDLCYQTGLIGFDTTMKCTRQPDPADSALFRTVMDSLKGGFLRRLSTITDPSLRAACDTAYRLWRQAWSTPLKVFVGRSTTDSNGVYDHAGQAHPNGPFHVDMHMVEDASGKTPGSTSATIKAGKRELAITLLHEPLHVGGFDHADSLPPYPNSPYFRELHNPNAAQSCVNP